MTAADGPERPNDRLRRVEALYHEMLGRPARERAAALTAACPEDPALAAEVQSLLDQPESTAGLFAEPAMDLAARVVSAGGPVLTGRRMGAFEVQSLLGTGGMGEVYRAHDTKLGRHVAIKVLPAAVATDAERMSRFRREARMLAALNHPNIASIYGLEEAAGQMFLVMELVEGEDLSLRIVRGAMPLKEALPIARQIVEAIDAAHERGIIHRDLKPANIKVRADGTVKVLDFGLAKALEPAGSPATDPTESPTLTGRATRMGMILGTAAYMAPEQALGKTVDRRADIWSFGVVLYEMITGDRAFKGDDVASTLGAVLRDTPPLAGLPASVPPPVRRLLERCLDRDPKTRLREIGEARIEIARAETDAPDAKGAGAPRGRRFLRSLALPAALVVALVAVMARGPWRDLFRSPPESRLSMPLGPGLQYPGISAYVAVAPDGASVAFGATKAPGGTEIYLRRLDQIVASPLGQPGSSPFFSPDGQWLAFFHDGKLKKIPAVGGAPTEITSCPNGDGDWGREGDIVFSDSSDRPANGIRRVSASGGALSTVTSLDLAAGQTHHLAPQLLPGGRNVIFTIRSDGPKFQLAVAPIMGGATRVIANDALFGRYLGQGVLIFQRGGSLLAARFDEETFTLSEGAPVLGGVHHYWRNPTWAVSGGTLVYRPQEDQGRTLVWVARDGAAEAVGAPPNPYWNPRLSPRGDRIAVGLAVQGGTQDIWTYDLGSRRLQREMGDVASPVWTPDGARLLLERRRRAVTEILSLRLDGGGTAEPLIQSPSSRGPSFITKDGRTLVYHDLGSETGLDLMSIDPTAHEPPRVVVRTTRLEAGARLHPSERWMAYATDLNGREDVFVTPFPDGGTRIPVTLDGGREPVWSRDGRELFYRKGNAMFSTSFRVGPPASFDRPKLLFEASYLRSGGPGNTQYDVAPDGRFLMMKEPEKETPALGVILNWTETLRKAIGAF